MTTMDRAGYVAGLRALADLLEQHPELELPYNGHSGAINVIPTGDQRQQLAAWARALGRAEKSSRDEYFDLVGRLHGLKLKVICDRDEVCDRIPTGTETVTREILDPSVVVPTITVTEEIETYRWECRPVLAAECGGRV